MSEDSALVGSSSKESLEELKKEIDRLKQKLAVCESKEYRMLENMPQIVFAADSSGRILYFNKRWEKYTGLAAAESSNEEILARIDPEQREKVLEEWQKAIDLQQKYETRIKLRDKKDVYKTFIFRIWPVRDDRGEIDKWLGKCSVISKLTKAEAELEKKQQFIEALLENLSDGIVACDEKGVLSLFNPATEELHGLPQESLTAEQWIEYYSLYLKDGKTRMSTEEIPLFRALKGESVNEVEMKIVPKNGKARHVLTSADPILSRDGKKLGAVAAMRDITDRVMAEKKLKAREAKFRTLFDRSSYGVIVLTPKGTIKEINRTTLDFIGIEKREEIVGKNFNSLEWWKESDKEKLKVSMARAVKGERLECEIELIGIEKKESATIEFTIRPVLNSSNKVTEIIAEARDISEKKAAEKALEKSESRWRLAVVATGDGVFDWDIKTDYLYMSKQLKNTIGYKEEEIENTYQAWAELVHPEDIDRVEERIRIHIEAKTQKYRAEYRLRCKNGSYKWILGRGKAEWDEKTGKPIRMIGYLSDIDDRVKAEKELEAREAKFRTLFDRSFYWVIVLSLDGKIKEINRTILDFIGTEEKEELIERNFTDIKGLTELDKQRLKEAIATASTGKPAECEIEAIGVDNKYVTMEFAIRPVFNPAGEVIEIIAEARDITRKKQAELALEISEERWRLILGGTGDGIFDWDITTGEAFMSEALKEMIGYEDGEIENKFSAWAELVHPQDMPKVQKAIADHLEKRTRKYNVEYRLRCKDGSYKWILAWGQAKWDKTGKPVRMVGSHTDIDDRKKTEEQLKRREALYRLLADNSTDVICVHNEVGKIEYISPATIKMLGYRPEELLGKSIYELLHLDDAIALQKTYSAVGKIPEKLTHRQRLCRRDGSYVWVETIERFVRGRNSKVSGKIISVSRDISDRKVAEQEILLLNQELEERVEKRTAQLEAANRAKDGLIAKEKQARAEIQVYADIVKNIQIGLCIWELPDLNDISSFRLLTTNAAASEVIGVDLESRVGEKMIEIFPEALEESREYLEAFAEAIETKETREFSEFHYQKQGSSEVILALKAFPLPGNCVGVGFEDITRRKETERALITSNRQYSNVVNSVREVIFQTDERGKWTFLNPAWKKITKYTVAKSINKPFIDYVFAKKDRKNLQRLFENLITQKRKYFEYEFQCQTQKGGMRWLEIKFQLDRDEEGNVLGTVGTIDDISDRKEAEVTLEKRAKQLSELNNNLLATTKELQERNQELDSFAHVISHDLKEPLRAVSRLAQWLQEDLEGKLDDNTRYQMSLLEKRVDRMQGFIEGLLQYCRLGRTQSEPELIDLNEFLAEIIDSLSPPEEFKITVDGQMPSLHTESLPLQQVFFNLISNAIKHHHLPDGEINISHRDIGEFYEFSISDNGPGIDPANHDRIFVIFKTLKADKSTKNTGIGLAIVKKSIVDRGAKIEVESELGKGTTFRFTWPKLNLPRE